MRCFDFEQKNRTNCNMGAIIRKNKFTSLISEKRNRSRINYLRLEISKPTVPSTGAPNVKFRKISVRKTI